MLRIYLLVSLTPSKSKILDGDCAQRFCSKLNSDVGVRLVLYLLDAEKSGDIIYVKRTNKGVKRVSFLDNVQRKSRVSFLKWK